MVRIAHSSHSQSSDSASSGGAIGELERLRQEILGHSDALLEVGDDARHDLPRDEFVHAFLVDGTGYLVPAGTPAVLLQLLEIRRLPFSPIWFQGLVHHRGDLVPVFDLPRFLDPSAAASQGRYLLVIGEHEAKAALRVDQVVAFAAVGTDTAGLDAPRVPWIRRSLRINDRIFLELDLEVLFGALSRRLDGTQLMGESTADSPPRAPAD